jgi:GNAT superfamily N-acetyltransferase
MGDVTLTVRPLDPQAELAAYLAVGNQANAMPQTAAQWWDRQVRVPEGRPNRHLVGEREGRIVAVADVADWALTRNAVEVRLVVDGAERGRGHGRALAAAVEEELRSIEAATIVVVVRDDDPASRAWAERRGFAVYDHAFESHLDLERFDVAPHRWAVERCEAAGLAIEASDDGERLYELVLALFPDVPAVDIDAPGRDEFQRGVMERAGAFTMVGRDGDVLAGLAIVVPSGEEGAWNWVTGVRREYRGRGLARALKVATAEEARRRGRRWLGTNNNAVNAPMLAVNEALGYERKAGLLWLRRPGSSEGR